MTINNLMFNYKEFWDSGYSVNGKQLISPHHYVSTKNLSMESFYCIEGEYTILTIQNIYFIILSTLQAHIFN